VLLCARYEIHGYNCTTAIISTHLHAIFAAKVIITLLLLLPALASLSLLVRCAVVVAVTVLRSSINCGLLPHCTSYTLPHIRALAVYTLLTLQLPPMLLLSTVSRLICFLEEVDQ
jgi:hypothetical protein